MRRIVITGMGLISPLGCKKELAWQNLLAGKSGIRKIENLDLKDIPVKIAGNIKWGEGEDCFNPLQYFEPKELKRHDKFVLYGMAAGSDALADAGWNHETASEQEKERCGVLIGSGFGGLQTLYDTAMSFEESGMKKLSPFFIPACLVNMIAGNLAILPLFSSFSFTKDSPYKFHRRSRYIPDLQWDASATSWGKDTEMACYFRRFGV